ncbi:MAG: hypothetical protein MZV63_12240 [Marinilabiliales bacterium]|nr:hypothetical protein [Marinilabiliales bacterium]
MAGTIFSDENGFNWKKTFLSQYLWASGYFLNQVIICCMAMKGPAGNYATVFYGLARGKAGNNQY